MQQKKPAISYSANACKLLLTGGICLLVLNGFGQRFSDESLNLGVVHSMVSSDGFGAGASFFDFDGDGWDDITLVSENDSLYTFINTGGAFERIHLTGIIEGSVRQAIWVDYDNDGDYDLFISTYNNGVKIFRNEGDLDLVDVTNEIGFTGLFTTNYGFTFADYDRDGDLDAYLARYRQFGSPDNPMDVNALYRNNGDGTFVNVTFEAGVSNGTKLSFMGGWMDYNSDGWPDLMVINDKLSDNNSLYHNNGDGTFTDVTEATGAEMPLTDAMSATFADFDNDLDLDFYSTSTYHLTTPPKLLVNHNGEYFTEEADARGLNFNFWSWGAAFFDADNDTNLDLYIATGFTTGHWQPEVESGYFENNGDHTFTNVTQSEIEGSSKAASYGLAIGDVNNDGYAEILSLNAENYNSFLWLNEGGENNYVKISLSGTVSNSMAVGSWINVFAAGSQYVHYTRCGEGYCSQNSQHHIFGLADASTVDSLKVVYPSGHTDTYYNMAVNEHHYLTEGETYWVSLNPSVSVSLCVGEAVTLNAGVHDQYLWSTGDTTASVEITEPGNYYVQTWNEFGLSALSDTVVVELVPPTQVEILTVDVSCAGMGDGSITLVVTEGILNNLLWNTGDTTEYLTALQPGVYTFTALNEWGCEVTGETSVDGPAPLLGQAEVSNALCYGEPSGTVTLNILGGTSPFSPEWAGLNPDGLPAGEYNIVVNDAHGCEIEVAFGIEQPDSIALYLSLQHASNGDENGAADLVIEGGTTPYNVAWSNGEADTLSLNGLAPGSYNVTVFDANGCVANATFIIDTNTSLWDRAVNAPLLYPNPNNGRFRIVNCPTQLMDVVVIDHLGRTVAAQSNIQCGDDLRFNNLKPGTYIIEASSPDNRFYLRLLVTEN